MGYQKAMKWTLDILEMSSSNSWLTRYFAFVLLEIHPLILAHVRVVDLSLSSEEIQELMLTQLLQSECKELLIQHLQVQNDKQLLQDKLVSEEVRGPATIYHHSNKKIVFLLVIWSYIMK